MDLVFNVSLQDSQCPSFILGPYRSSMERDETMDSIVSVSSGMSGMVRDAIHLCCHEIHIAYQHEWNVTTAQKGGGGTRTDIEVLFISF